MKKKIEPWNSIMFNGTPQNLLEITQIYYEDNVCEEQKLSNEIINTKEDLDAA